MISPFAIQEMQNCARQRFLSRYEQGGNLPVKPTVKEAVDEILKPELSRLLLMKAFNPDFKEGVDIIAAGATQEYRQRFSSGLNLLPSEDAKISFEETEALIEALIRAAAVVVLPDFKGAKSITIPAKVGLKLGDIEIEAGPDVLVEYEGGRCGLFWHTVGTNLKPNLWILRHSIAAAVLAFDLDLVEVRYVKRGERKDGVQMSNLTRTDQYTRGATKAKKGLLQRVPVWRLEGGVKEYVRGRSDLHLAANFGMDWAPRDPLNPAFRQYRYTKNSMTLTQMLSPSELNSWKIQVQAQESQIAQCMDQVNVAGPSLRPTLIDAYFPQQRASCVFCHFVPVCNQAITDLQGSGLFKRRV